MKRLFISVIILFSGYFVTQGQSQPKATWIWFPGDYELWLHKEVSLRRTERNAFYPAFFRVDLHYGAINFKKEFTLSQPENIEIKTTGRFNVKIDSRYYPEHTDKLKIPAGKHSISIDIANYDTVPCLYVKGTTLVSDSSWGVSCYNTQWIPAASGDYNSIDGSPVHFRFIFSEISPVKSENINSNILLDFGKETFGYLRLKGIKGTGEVKICYGESREEALSPDSCETYDKIIITKDSSASYTLNSSKALRYAYVIPSKSVTISNCSFITESLPLTQKGKFKCSNDKLNKIWEVSAYTLSLTTREFMLDGIKRDRWLWSGDAIQSFLMNYYLFFDTDVNRRSIIAERGKDPVEAHINHIVDYSYYWFLSIYDYYLYTGDVSLIKMMYPKMLTMMDFCATRLNKNNFIVGRASDWIYLDWADMDKEGELSAYQVLYARSLETLAACAKIMNDTENANKYSILATDMKARTLQLFWNDNLHALVHNRKNDKQIDYVTRYSNMFALMYGYLDEKKSEDVKKYVLMNDSVQTITTPYMRFYELAALCEIGEHKYVVNEILNYWGGMLDLGATSFWEVYNPKEKGTQHLAMYGRPFGRSLCHAWGASPVYLLGKYYLGVQPKSAGYKSWICEPHLGGLDWMEGSVPTPFGNIDLSISKTVIKIKSMQRGGILKFRSAKTPKTNMGNIIDLGNNVFELKVDMPKTEYIIKYEIN
jgi:alpha-L-rhamnosidase